MSRAHKPVLPPDLAALLAEALQPEPVPAPRNAALRDRILARAAAAPTPALLRGTDWHWVPFLPGIDLRPLRIDRAARTQTSLWRLAPGATIPQHPHAATEECLVVAGVLQFEGRDLRAGDYLQADPGVEHATVATRTGATLLIRSELNPHLERAFALAGL